MDKFVYEEKVKRIEEILSSLSKNNLSIKESMDMYREAQELLVMCEKYLTDLQSSVTIVNSSLPDVLRDEN